MSVPGSKFQVTMSTGVDILHIFEQSGIAVNTSAGCPRPLGPPLDGTAIEGADKLAWSKHRQCVCAWALEALSVFSLEKLGRRALRRLVEYLDDPKAKETRPCKCDLCASLVLNSGVHDSRQVRVFFCYDGNKLRLRSRSLKMLSVLIFFFTWQLPRSSDPETIWINFFNPIEEDGVCFFLSRVCVIVNS
jgi:hypothetical protein